MISHHIHAIKTITIRKLTMLLELQLFLSCWAIGILMCWGLPFSLLSPLAMVVLMPFLTLFLILSSLIFFTELFFIPNQLLIYLLEYLSSAWLYLLQSGSKAFLIAYPFYAYVIAVLLPIMAVIILVVTNQAKIRCMLLAMLLASMCILSYRLVPDESSFTSKGTYRSITITKEKNGITLSDPGALSFRQIESFIQYSLATEYRKHFGMAPIDHYHLEKPNGCTFKTALEAIEHLTIKTIHIPYWDEPGTQAQRKWFMRLKHRCEKEHIALKRYKKLLANTDRALAS